MKKLVIGIIIGVIIGSAASYAANEIIATQATYPILVNGTKYTGDKPALNVNGSTYLPLRDMANALNIPINWSKDKGRVEIGVTPTTEAESSTTIDTTATTQAATVISGTDNANIVFNGLKLDYSNRWPFPYQHTAIAKVTISNNGTDDIACSPDDFKFSYKLKSGTTAFLRQQDTHPDGIYDNLPWVSNTKVVIPAIKPGQTQTFKVSFEVDGDDSEVEWESYTLTLKGKKVPLTR